MSKDVLAGGETLMSQAFINSVGVAVLAAMLALLSAAFWRAVRGRDELFKRVTELERQLAVTQAAVTPISAAMLAVWVKELTHPHTPELDALLAKLQPYTLTHVELLRMTELLTERTKDMGPEITESERQAAAMMPALIRKVLTEAELPIAEVDVVMVSIPKDAGPK